MYYRGQTHRELKQQKANYGISSCLVTFDWFSVEDYNVFGTPFWCFSEKTLLNGHQMALVKERDTF